MKANNLWFGHILAGLAGALTPLAFSPFGYWPVQLASFAILFRLIDGQTARTSAQRCFAFGVGLFGTGVSWVYVSIHQFGSAPVPLAAALTALFVIALAAAFCLPAGWLFGRLTRARGNWRNVLLFAGIWLLGEWTRTWLLTGFPWLLSGYVLLDTPFSGLAPVAGVTGLSLLIILAGATIGALLHQPRVSFRRLPLLLLATVVAIAGTSGWLLDKRQWTKETGTSLSFSAVQGNIPQNLKWQPGHLDNTIRTYMRLSASSWHKDLLFWPENAIPAFYQRLTPFMEQLQERASQNKTALVIGMPWLEPDNRYYNSLVGLGDAQGQYFKQKLVPFGEFVPFANWLRGLIAFFNLPMSSFSQGTEQQAGLHIKNLPLASYICYEVVYPDFAARQARDKAFLLTVSNDTWFGTSIGPEQHFQMVRMRSLETGRYQLRVTNDGMTALIDPQARVISQLPRYRTGVLEGELPAMTGNTPFTRYGSWPVLAIALMMVSAGLFRRSAS